MATLVPMAKSDPWPVWPLPEERRHVPLSGSRRFGASRVGGERYHAGVDLGAPRGSLVIAPEAGELVRTYKFNGPDAYALLLQTDIGPVFNLAEVEPRSWREFGLTVGTRTTSGSWVDKGEPIARVGINPGGSTMLHFESYTRGTRANQRWFPGKDPPARLLDPSHYLLTAAEGVKPDDPIIPPLDPDTGGREPAWGFILAGVVGIGVLSVALAGKRKR